MLPSVEDFSKMPVIQQIENIDQNITSLTELLEEQIQKDAELEKAQLQEAEKTSLNTPENPPDVTPEPSSDSDDLGSGLPNDDDSIPIENPVDETADESLEVFQLILEEMQEQNESLLAITEMQTEIVSQNEITNHADHIVSMYGLVVFPALIIIFALWRLIKPFT